MKSPLRMALSSIALACTTVFSSGCSPNANSPGGGNPIIYQHFADRWKARYGDDFLGRVCEDRSAKECFRFGSLRRMRGLWTFAETGGFERSFSFLDEGQMPPSSESQRQELLGGVALYPEGRLQDLRPGDYEIEFIGRKTLYRGEYSIHGARHMVVLDRLISVRAVSGESWVERQLGGRSTGVPN